MKIKLSFREIKLTLEEKSVLRKDIFFLFLSGLLTGISFPPFPFPFTLLIFISLVPYFFVIEKRDTLLQINRYSYLFFFVFSLITIYWVGSWQSKADPFLMIGGAVLLFFFPAVLLIISSIFAFSNKLFNKEISFWLFPIFWTTVEFLLTLTDLKFPWLTLGHGLAKFTSFIQIADIIGANGLSIIALYINVLIYKSIKTFSSNYKISIKYAFFALLIFIIILSYGLIKLNDEAKFSSKYLRVGVVQPDLDPWKKWELDSLDEIKKIYFQLSEQCIEDGAQILIWPETAFPVYLFSGRYYNIVDSIYSFLQKNNVYLLTGMPDYLLHYDNIPDDAKKSSNKEFHYSTYNSILLLNPSSYEIQRYGKMHLVPLGEKVPFVDIFPFLGDWFGWGVGISSWNEGRDTTIFQFKIAEDTIKTAGVVCFESVFPDFITNFIRKGAQFIVVVTNDSWYGNSSGPYQHKEFAALRAVENRKAVVRSANGGISCLINQFGITEFETKMFTKTSFVVNVPLNDHLTFYSKYPLIIPLLTSIFSLWVAGAYALKRIKNSNKINI